MKMKTRIGMAVMVSAVALLTVTGCSYPGDAEDRAAFRGDGPDSSPVPSASSPSTRHETETPESTTRPKPDKEKGEGSKSDSLVSLEPDSGVMYLQAIQHFSPKLERWVVDEEAGDVTYTRYTCVGSVDAQGKGPLEQQDSGLFHVTWSGNNPMRLSAGDYTEIEITEDTLTNGIERSYADAETVMAEYKGMCGKTGKGIADFVLG